RRHHSTIRGWALFHASLDLAVQWLDRRARPCGARSHGLANNRKEACGSGYEIVEGHEARAGLHFDGGRPATRPGDQRSPKHQGGGNLMTMKYDLQLLEAPSRTSRVRPLETGSLDVNRRAFLKAASLPCLAACAGA